ncbi:MAG: AAA family ATPase [Candidatus Heimdallarchaeum endolithica]|uniref:AAA family ATPase n=1 Tax=Candidatus Heimdallarchaeum endolithica TaxID=2876572 RepID=A0A9Y1BRK6_9ARCH|nr:MAG: AAA family ATPase [Candidatus Heimdallarchaeum endolithica]
MEHSEFKWDVENQPRSRISVIAVHSQKGGPGKTTISVNLALEFAKRNKKTLFVDLDIGGGTAQHVFNISKEEIKLTINDILLGNKNFNKNNVNHTEIENLDVIVSKEDVEFGSGLLNLMKEIQDNAFFRLIEFVNTVKKNGYDCIVFDCTPGWKIESLYALCVSDINLFILRPSTFSFKGAKYMLNKMYREIDVLSSAKTKKPSTYFIYNQTPFDKESEVEEILEKWKKEIVEAYKPKKIEFLKEIRYSDEINNRTINGNYFAPEGSELHLSIQQITDKLEKK